MEDEILSGILNYLKPSTLGKKWNKKWAVLYKRSVHGIRRLELHDTRDSFEKRQRSIKKNIITISLEKCTNVVDDVIHDGKKNENVICLSFTSEDKKQFFSWDSSEEMAKWFKAISSVVFTMDLSMEDDEQVYQVEMKQSDLTVRLDLDGMYLLSVSSEDIDLVDPHTRKSIIKWPLRFLRKYGRDKQEFSLEAGRRCPSGPGMFYFITDQYNAIFQEVESNVKRLASQPYPNPSDSSGNSSNKYQPVKKPRPVSTRIPTTAYEDPIDFRRDSSSSQPEDYTYNEPLNVQSPPTPKPLTGRNTAPKKPPRQSADDNSVYCDPRSPTATSKVGDDLNSQYSHLTLGGATVSERTEYDSISFPQWKAESQSDQDAAYATAATFSGRHDNGQTTSDSVYDHVKR